VVEIFWNGFYLSFALVHIPAPFPERPGTATGSDLMALLLGVGKQPFKGQRQHALIVPVGGGQSLPVVISCQGILVWESIESMGTMHRLISCKRSIILRDSRQGWWEYEEIKGREETGKRMPVVD